MTAVQARASVTLQTGLFSDKDRCCEASHVYFVSDLTVSSEMPLLSAHDTDRLGFI